MPKPIPKIMKYIFTSIVLYITIFLVLSPETTLSAARDAVEMCLSTLIPSLFPFFVCSGLLSSLGFSALCSRLLSPMMRKLFDLPGCSALAFFLGLVSGYPVGAHVAAELYSNGQCTKAESEHMTAFCNNSGPLFVIGVVGTSFLKSPTLGYCLYISHIISAIIIGFLFRFYKTRERTSIRQLPPSPCYNKKDAALSFGCVIDNSVFSTLKVCGFVVFFSVFTSTLPQSPLRPILFSFAEITGGIHELSNLELDISPKLALISFFLAFSGLSVLFQVSSIIAPKGISLTPYCIGKVLQGVLSAFLTVLLVRVFPQTQSAFSHMNDGFLQSASPLSVFFSSVFGALLVSLILAGVMTTAGLLRRK